MEYSALRLETLALHEVPKGSLATDAEVSPTAKMEVEAWKQLEGKQKVVEMEVKVQTSKGVEVTDDQWEFGTLSGFNSCQRESNHIPKLFSIHKQYLHFYKSIITYSQLYLRGPRIWKYFSASFYFLYINMMEIKRTRKILHILHSAPCLHQYLLY